MKKLPPAPPDWKSYEKKRSLGQWVVLGFVYGLISFVMIFNVGVLGNTARSLWLQDAPFVKTTIYVLVFNRSPPRF